MKLPAYGKALIEARRRGECPLCVHLIVGRNWRAPTPCLVEDGAEHRLLCIHPDDYSPGLYDFRCVAGIGIAMSDQDGLASQVNVGNGYPHLRAFGPFYVLIGEIGRWAAEIEVHSPGWRPVTASLLAYMARDYRIATDPDKNHGWPAWWSAEIERIHAERRDIWLCAVAERRQRTAERV